MKLTSMITMLQAEVKLCLLKILHTLLDGKAEFWLVKEQGGFLLWLSEGDRMILPHRKFLS